MHKALLRYHDPVNWPLIREALVNMGKKYLIGERPNCLVPEEGSDAELTPAQRRGSGRHGAKRFATKHPNQPDIRNDGKRKPGNRTTGNKNGNQSQQGNRNKTGGKAAGQPSGNGNSSGRPNRNGKPTSGQRQGQGQSQGGKPNRSRAKAR